MGPVFSSLGVPSASWRKAGATPLGAETFADEYLALLDDGWQPDLEEYVRRVPESLQEEVFQRIDAALANPDVVSQARSPSGQVEVVLVHPWNRRKAPEPDSGKVFLRVGWLEQGWRLVSLLVPRSIRDLWLGDLLILRHESKASKESRARRLLRTASALLDGLAQRTPLLSSIDRPGGSQRPARLLDRLPFLAWRATGPVLLLAILQPSFRPFLVAAVLFGASLLGLLPLVLHREREATALQTRLANAVLGSSLTMLVVTASLGALAASLLVGHSKLGTTGYLPLCLHVLVVLDAMVAAMLTASGWSPELFCPKSLIRTRPTKRRWARAIV